MCKQRIFNDLNFCGQINGEKLTFVTFFVTLGTQNNWTNYKFIESLQKKILFDFLDNALPTVYVLLEISFQK